MDTTNEMAEHFKSCGYNFADFTPEEQEKISAKIKDCMSRGKTQEQAVAEAINIVAPNKSRKASEAKFGSTPQLIGGQYKASQNADGTWNILDVPIMSEAKLEDAEGKKILIDRKWMEEALAKAKERSKGQYFSRLHINHTGEDKDVIEAGFIYPKEIKEIEIEGKTRLAVFSDLLAIPDAIYQRIKGLSLPYRSVEANLINPDIKSLALMAIDAPFFKLPILNISQEVKKFWDALKYTASYPLESMRAVNFSDNSEGKLFLFNFGGIQSMSKTKAEMTPEELKKFEEDEAKKKEEEKKVPAKAAEGEQMPGYEKAEASKLDKILELLTKLVGGKGEGQAAEEPPAQKPNKPVETGGAPSLHASEEFLKVKGQLKAVSDDVETYKLEKKHNQIATDFIKKNIEWNFSETDRPQILEILKTSGESGLKAFADGVKSKKFAEPKEDAFTQVLTNTGNGEALALDPELQKFAEKTPTNKARVLHYVRMWQEYPDSFKRGNPLSEFVSNNIMVDDKAGMKNFSEIFKTPNQNFKEE